MNEPIHSGLKLYEIDEFNSKTEITFPWAPELVSERANEWMSAAERASEASSAEQAKEWEVQVNERTEEHMAQYSTRRFHSHSIWCNVPFW